MKGKKRYIILLILIGAFIGFLYFTKDKRKDQIKKQDEKIEEDTKLREKKAIKLTNYIKVDKDKYGEYDSSDGNLLIFKKNKVYYVLDNKGKELYFGVNIPEIMSNYNGTKSYYIVNNTIYDSEGNVIYDKMENGSSVVYINDEDVVINTGFYKTQIINIKSKDIKNIDIFIGYYKGIYVYTKNGKYVVLDNGEKEYDELYSRTSFVNDNSIIHLKSKDGDIYLDKDKGKISKDDYLKEKINDKYYINHDTCTTVKSYSDDKNILDECIFDYDKVNDNFYAFITKDNLYLLRGDKLEKEVDYIRGEVADNTYFASKGEDENYYSVFYENGENKELECASLVGYAGNDIFSCSDKFEGYFIENNKIRNDKYDYISCNVNGNYCVVSSNDKEGLYYMGEKIIEPVYKEILLENDYIVQELEDSYYIYYTEKDGKRLKKDDLNPKEEKEKINEVDIDKIVEEYKIDKDLIKDNKELFTKYAFIVENNEGLKDYKKYIYDYFKVVVDKKDAMDEEIFLNSLNKLSIVVENKLNIEHAAGLYTHDVVVHLLQQYADKDYIIYHELMHFIDFQLNNNESETVCLYNKNIISKDDYLKLSIEEKRKVKCDYVKNSIPQFMVEGGAELYRSRYFANSYSITYSETVGLYNIFEYLFGEDTMSDIYFGHKNLYAVLSKYLSKEEYEKFEQVSGRITDINTEIQPNDFSTLFELLIKIYENHKGKEWYNDNIFCLLLDNTFGKNDVTNSKYYNIYEKIYEYNAKEKSRLAKLIVEKTDLNVEYYPKYIYENKEIVLLRLSDNTNVKNNKIYKFKYNVNNKTIEKIGIYDYTIEN